MKRKIQPATVERLEAGDVEKMKKAERQPMHPTVDGVLFDGMMFFVPTIPIRSFFQALMYSDTRRLNAWRKRNKLPELSEKDIETLFSRLCVDGNTEMFNWCSSVAQISFMPVLQSSRLLPEFLVNAVLNQRFTFLQRLVEYFAPHLDLSAENNALLSNCLQSLLFLTNTSKCESAMQWFIFDSHQFHKIVCRDLSMILEFIPEAPRAYFEASAEIAQKLRELHVPEEHFEELLLSDVCRSVLLSGLIQQPEELMRIVQSPLGSSRVKYMTRL